MQHLRPLAKGAALTVGSLSLLAGPLAGGTWAAERPHQRPAVTEDTDTNDGGTRNNVVDDGDNAHPSGKDRSVEAGGSGNQGWARHDPDDDGHGPDRSNGGVDQPDGPGGVDLADQDGNNGCGNDDDFEDDNEGWCGKPRETVTPAPSKEEHGHVEAEHETKPETTPATEVEAAAVTTPVDLAPLASTTSSPVGAEVLGLELTRPDVVAASATTAPAAEVEAASLTRSAPAGELPFTGTDGVATAVAGAGALGLGWLLTRFGRRRTTA